MNQPTLPPSSNPPASRPRRAWFGPLMVAVVAALLLAVLCFLTMNYFLPVIMIGGVIFLMTGLHYFVWGWWLCRVLRSQCDES